MFDVWKNVLTEIEHSVPRSVFLTWFSKGVELVSAEDGEILIKVPNVFFKKQLEVKYFDNLKEAFEKNNITVNNISYLVQGANKQKVVSREITEEQPSRTERIEKIQRSDVFKKVPSGFKTNLNPKYTMDNFVIGSNNDLAVSVAKNVISHPGEKYNPFFLYGGPGLGKTHLVQAIGNELLRQRPKLKILYTPVSHFYSDFINSIKNNRGDEFSQKFQKLDVLIIDDFQLIVGKDRSQEEFFNIFNDLYQTNKQIIVTSDRLPSQIRTLDERLASRLAMAGAIDLQMPNFEDRCAILKSKAEFGGVEIEDEAIEFLAENVKTNIRDLESEFMRVLAVSELRGVSPLQLIEDGYISTTTKERKIRTASSKQIVEKIARYFGLTVKEMCGKSRVSNIKTARQVTMYFLSKELGMSTPKIALEVGVKDHTTVMHGIKKIESDIKNNFALRNQVEEIKEKIYG